MSTKKKATRTTTKTKRTAQWNEYFKAAITGLAMNIDLDLEDPGTSAVENAAQAVKTAEKIADIAEARNT